MKILVFLEHDIICRNFVMGGALHDLVRAADVRFVFPESGVKRLTLDPDSLPLGAVYERIPIDDIRQQTWRWILFAKQLSPSFDPHKRAIRRIRRFTLGWKATTLLTIASTWIGRPFFERIVAKRLARHGNHALDRLLNRERPDVVLHPSVLEGVFINDLVSACKARGIPLVIAMNSWDNPSTKQAVVGAPDRLLVWGPQTQAHAMRFMELTDDTVVRFGAAQFDVFRDPARVSRQEFCQAHDLNPDRSIVLFAGSNAQTDEVGTLSELDAAITDGRLPNLQIVYRPHPWGGGGRDGIRLANTRWRNVRIDRSMAAYIERIIGGDHAITLPDYRDTHDLLCAVDAVISPLSTILLEAALHGKPAVLFAPDDGGRVLSMMMPMLHFEDFLKLPDVAVARSTEELLAQTRDLSDRVSTAARGARLRTAMHHFVTPFDRSWGERIVELLASVATRGKGGARASPSQVPSTAVSS